MPRLPRFSHVLIALAALGVIQLEAPVLHAQSTAAETARVTQLFKNGKAAFAKGDMPEAERLFGEAFALRKSADIAANLGQSELEQQKYRKAAEHFQWALVNLLPSATDAQRKAVETGLARSRAEVAILRLDIKPEGADVLVGDQPVGKSPVASGVYVEPGEVIVSVKHDGFIAVDKRVLVSKGTEQAIEISLMPREGDTTAAGPAAPPPVDSGLEHSGPPPATDTSASKPKSLVPAFVATGVAVAGGVVGLVFTLNANSKEGKADDRVTELGGPGACGPTGSASAADCADLKSQRDSVDSSRNVALGSFILGGAAAVVAGYFYWDALAHRESKTAAKPGVTFAFTPRVELGQDRRGAASAPSAVKLSFSGTF